MRLIDADNVLAITPTFGLARIEFYLSAKEKYHRDPTFGDGMDFVREAIRNAPSVDAVPVAHGHWIVVNTVNYGYCDTEFEEKCSVCGRRMNRYDTEPKNAYCPKCGAKMDGGAEDAPD